MDEDEEVDIVGGLDNFMSKNEREISNISSGQILSCEYTVHPRWLADNSDAAAQWPDNLLKQSSQDEMELVQDEVVIEEPAPIDFDWCEEQETEEVSHCNDIIFEQDIPASLEEEVITNSANEETELDENSDNCSQSSQQTIEERQNRSPDDYVPNSSNTSNTYKEIRLEKIEKPIVKFKQTLLVNKNVLKLNQRNLVIDPKAGTSLLKPRIEEKPLEKIPTIVVKTVLSKPQPKFQQSLLIKRDSSIAKYQKKSKISTKKHRARTHGLGKGKTISKNAHSEAIGGGKAKKFVDLHGENITINHEADECVNDIDEVKPDIPSIGATSVKIETESDSDIEVDIESETPNDLIEASSSAIIPEIKIESSPPIAPLRVPPLKIKTLRKKEYEAVIIKPDVDSLSPELQEILNSTEPPQEELILSTQNISDLEKYFHPEFFVGRPTKTPERYMKIRDFIINAWHDIRPAYVSKTTVRNGLKHCGDVNCISRIHCMLEQIGAINFGQSGEHFEYIRPLSKLKEHFMQSAQNKKSQSSSSSNYDLTSLVMGRRQRNKSITFHSTDKEIDANYTVSHVNGIPTLVYAAMPKEREHHRREASKPIKIEFELIECLRFAKDKIPPFKISMSLSTLLCLHLHALSSKYEVMGFLGGFCTKSVGRNKLSLTRYKPTKTAHQTGTTCEMCPVSQVEQAANLTSEGYDLLGWFHSHPTFEPNPSRTDVATQADMQLQFSMESDRPFIGFILGCMDMSYNCMYIMPKDLHKKDTFDIIPYGFEVDIIKDCSSLQNDIGDVLNVIDRQSHDYVQTIQNFTRTATELLKYHGYELNISDYL